MEQVNPLFSGARQRRRTVYDYFNQALQHPRNPDLPIQGELTEGNDGLLARFFLDVQGDRMNGASYRCTTCVTLVAYCELLAETVGDSTLREVKLAKTSDLIAALPGVPSYRHDRAELAMGALHSAVGRVELARR